jgi:hypothetical protein
VTLVVVLVVALGALIGIAGLRLAQLRSVPLAGAREAPLSGAGAPQLEVSADAFADPDSAQVADVLQRYFAAISAHDYAAWSATVTPGRAAQLGQTDWTKGYRSTQEGTIRLSRIDQTGPGSLLALVSFVSTQSPADAPPPTHLAQLCWREAVPLTGSPPRVDVSKPGDVLRGPCH